MREASPLKEFARYTSLNVLGMIGLSCYILADTFFVSLGLGADGLAALNLAIPIYSFINGSGLMIGMGGGTRYSILKSQGNHREANRVFTNVLYLAAVLTSLFVAAGLLFAGDIVRLFGGTGNVFTMSRTYLRVILLFAPAFLMNNVLLCFVRNDGAPQLSMAAMLGGSFSNVVLDWVFIFPLRHGNLPGGIRHRTGASDQHLQGLPHFLPKENQFKPVACRPQGQRTIRILSSGVPSLVTEVSSGIVIIVFNSLILGMEGNTGVAAYGVIANLSLVVISIYTGIAQGIQPILSRSYGVGDQDRLSATLRYAVIAMLGVSVAIYGALLAFAPQIAAVFNSEGSPTLQAIAVQGLRLYFIACPLCRVQRSALDVLHLYGPAPSRPRHFPAAWFFPHHPWPFCWLLWGRWWAFGWPSCRWNILAALLAVGLFLRSRRKPDTPAPFRELLSFLQLGGKAAFLIPGEEDGVGLAVLRRDGHLFCRGKLHSVPIAVGGEIHGQGGEVLAIEVVFVKRGCQGRLGGEGFAVHIRPSTPWMYLPSR